MSVLCQDNFLYGLDVFYRYLEIFHLYMASNTGYIKELEICQRAKELHISFECI